MSICCFVGKINTKILYEDDLKLQGLTNRSGLANVAGVTGPEIWPVTFMLTAYLLRGQMAY